MELFSHPDAALSAFQRKERKWRRRMLLVGGRSPNAAVQILMGLPSSSVMWKVRRAGLFLKLANAAVGSLRHLSFIAHHHLNSPWFLAAQSDLNLVVPDVRLIRHLLTQNSLLLWEMVGGW